MKLLRSIVACVNKPLPGWITIMLLSAGVALASVPVLNASLSVPSGGTITDSNASPSTCVGVNAFKQFVYGTNCSTTGGGDTITSPNSTLSIGGTSLATTLDLNLGTANTWTAAQTFSGLTNTGQANNTFVPSSACATNGPTAPVCIGSPTSTIGLAIGKITGGWGGTTASNSGQVAVCANTGAADRCGFMSENSSGQLLLGSNGAGNVVLTSSGGFDLASAGLLRATFVTQGAASNFAGTCTMSAATSCTATVGHTFTTPICQVTVQGATAISGACSVSGTTVTVTAASSNSATWAWFVLGNPS